MAWYKDVEWLGQETLVKGDSDTTKGPACPVTSVPSRVSFHLAKVVWDRSIQEGLHCCDDVRVVRNHETVDEMANVRL